MNREEVVKYLKENEMDVQHAKAALVFATIIWSVYADSDKAHGVNYSPVFSYFFNNEASNFYQIIPQRHIKAVSQKIYLDYCKDPKTLEDKIKKHERLDKQLDKFWNDYEKRRNELSDEDIYKAYENFTKIFKEWWYYGVIGEDKGEVINQEVIPRFAKRHNLPLGKAKEIMVVLAHPEEQSALNLERIDFLKICLELKKKNSKKLDKMIKDYIKNYFYFKTDFYEAKEINSEDILRQAQKETGDVSKEIKKINNNFKKIHQQREKLLKTLKLTKEDEKDIYFSQRITEWFDKRKVGTMVQCYYLYFLLKDVVKRYNVEYHDLAFSSHEELREFLKGGELNKQEIEKRDRGVFYAVVKESPEPDAFYERPKEMLELAIRPRGNELKGQVASTGNLTEITGIARVVSNPASEEFKEGDILVTSMTRIEFVPLMRRAKAVVTDEGGIVCHAAIVSRELGVPCIIGTKTATRQLKTGDKIKLDLEKGTITKI